MSVITKERMKEIRDFDTCVTLEESAELARIALVSLEAGSESKQVDELTMWVKRLAHSLRKTNPDSKLQSDAMDYLSRKGLIGVEDILR